MSELNELANFRISVKPKQDKIPTMHWLPKMHKTPYKAVCSVYANNLINIS
jgi:hypothetical protein